MTLVADAKRRAVIFVTEGKEVKAIEELAKDIVAHVGKPEIIETVSIDMSRHISRG